jgi:prolipoprotein diacylglyceryl transferase
VIASGYIPSPASNGLHLGPFFFHAYGIAYVFAVAAAILITRRRWPDAKLVNEVALWGFPAGLIGGRIYFLVTTPSQVPDHWWGPFAVWQGGLGIWGGIAGGVAGGLWVLRRRRADIPRFMDAAAPALLVAQAIGRVGNYFNQELFGKPTSLPWGLKIDVAHRPPGYEQFATFQPTFLYEIIWNLSLASFLVWLGRTRRVKAPGLFALYVAGYSGFRMFEETLRIDYSNHLFGLRLNFFVAGVLCVFGLIWFMAIQRGWRLRRGAAALGLAWIAVWAGGCGSSGGAGQRRAYVPTSVAIPTAEVRSATPHPAITNASQRPGRKPTIFVVFRPRPRQPRANFTPRAASDCASPRPRPTASCSPRQPS